MAHKLSNHFFPVVATLVQRDHFERHEQQDLKYICSMVNKSISSRFRCVKSDIFQLQMKRRNEKN